jgi:hypothetical protein
MCALEWTSPLLTSGYLLQSFRVSPCHSLMSTEMKTFFYKYFDWGSSESKSESRLQCNCTFRENYTSVKIFIDRHSRLCRLQWPSGLRHQKVFARSKTGIQSSNTTRGMHVCLRIFSLFSLFWQNKWRFMISSCCMRVCVSPHHPNNA